MSVQISQNLPRRPKSSFFAPPTHILRVETDSPSEKTKKTVHLREQTNENRNQSLFAKRRRRRNPHSHRVNRGCGADEVVGDDPPLAPLAPAGLRSIFFEILLSAVRFFWISGSGRTFPESELTPADQKIENLPRGRRFSTEINIPAGLRSIFGGKNGDFFDFLTRGCMFSAC